MFPLNGDRLSAQQLREYMMRGTVVGLWERTETMTIAPGSTNFDATPIVWDTTLLDELGAMHPLDRSIIRPTMAGRYLVSGSVGFSGDTSGTIRQAIWWQTGVVSSAAVQSTNRVSPSSFAGYPVSVEAKPWPFEFDGDKRGIQLRALHDAGGNLSIQTGGVRPYICLTYLGPHDT